ncbi:hypothetical protein CRM73_00175 [Kocuria sp. CCUG 69068]|uniref:hypothetical protein n=1 Tax=Kocuria sp. CCUG 69068 TaxID=2043138 RepID=UPI001E6110E4|nr:hypothetical protein [Kocuria sp. CCUG 69068]
MHRTTVLPSLVHPASGIDLAAPGGVQALLDFHRCTFGDAVMEGNGDSGAGGDTGGSGTGASGDTGASGLDDKSGQNTGNAQDGKDTGNEDKAKDADKGFPADTPLAEMTVEQREAYWKDKARKHESTVRSRADYDDIKSKAEKWEEHERQSVPERERELQDAEKRGRDTAAQEAAAKYGPALVQATFQGLLAGSRKPEEIAEALDPLDLSKFLKDDLTVDTDKVKNYASRLAGGGKTWPDTGTGTGGEVPTRMSGADIAKKYL